MGEILGECITFSTDIRVDGSWVKVTQTQVVEPDFGIPVDR